MTLVVPGLLGIFGTYVGHPGMSLDIVWLPGLQLHPCKTYTHVYVGSRANHRANVTAHHTIK